MLFDFYANKRNIAGCSVFKKYIKNRTRMLNYFSKAAFTLAAIALKLSASFIAKCAKIFLSSSTLALLKPLINLE
jgi:hypothetical protein